METNVVYLFEIKDHRHFSVLNGNLTYRHILCFNGLINLCEHHKITTFNIK